MEKGSTNGSSSHVRIGGAPHDQRTATGFRQEYRPRIIGWYDGYVHIIIIIYAMGAAAFYIYVAHIHNVTPLEWLTVPLTFLFTNLFEWAVHRYVMHRPMNIKGLRAIYERHTLNHHQFFTMKKCASVIIRTGA